MDGVVFSEPNLCDHTVNSIRLENKEMMCTCVFVICVFFSVFLSLETGVALTSYFPLSTFRGWGFLLSGLWRSLQRGGPLLGASPSAPTRKRVFRRPIGWFK